MNLPTYSQSSQNAAPTKDEMLFEHESFHQMQQSIEELGEDSFVIYPELLYYKREVYNPKQSIIAGFPSEDHPGFCEINLWLADKSASSSSSSGSTSSKNSSESELSQLLSKMQQFSKNLEASSESSKDQPGFRYSGVGVIRKNGPLYELRFLKAPPPSPWEETKTRPQYHAAITFQANKFYQLSACSGEEGVEPSNLLEFDGLQQKVKYLLENPISLETFQGFFDVLAEIEDNQPNGELSSEEIQSFSILDLLRYLSLQELCLESS